MSQNNQALTVLQICLKNRHRMTDSTPIILWIAGRPINRGVSYFVSLHSIPYQKLKGIQWPFFRPPHFQYERRTRSSPTSSMGENERNLLPMVTESRGVERVQRVGMVVGLSGV